ncbi:hypothetical protein NDU88_003670 [Pleurodeles waltl]|uniref:Uncharacterized protein n=1 Tax=Pleurodeles waltl TaxID=8319 RepID=A0AAV7UD40_PLEWA|nr:hypothetical protein NDU88_003670 [Pleurodeles waltl]
MVSHFLTVNNTPTTNIATLWETVKVVVRGQFIAIAVRRSAVCCDRRQQQEGDILVLEVIHRQTGSLAVRRQLTNQRKQLLVLDEDKAEYALLCTKQNSTLGKQGGSTAGSQTPYAGHGKPGGRTKAAQWYPDLLG